MLLTVDSGKDKEGSRGVVAGEIKTGRTTGWETRSWWLEKLEGPGLLREPSSARIALLLHKTVVAQLVEFASH